KTWHRDVSPGLSEEEDIFGGWINLDLDRTQYFSCVPGTHTTKGVKAGFAKLTPEEMAVYTEKKKVFKVPPGHWVVFYQHIIHEVIPRKMEADSYRLFLGFRLTPQTKSLYDHQKLLEEQAVPLLPGGMRPQMYASM